MVNRVVRKKPVSEEQVAKIWKALAKYDIYTEEQLDEAIKNTKPLNIAIFVSPVPKRENVQ